MLLFARLIRAYVDSTAIACPGLRDRPATPTIKPPMRSSASLFSASLVALVATAPALAARSALPSWAQAEIKAVVAARADEPRHRLQSFRPDDPLTRGALELAGRGALPTLTQPVEAGSAPSAKVTVTSLDGRPSSAHSA